MGSPASITIHLFYVLFLPIALDDLQPQLLKPPEACSGHNVVLHAASGCQTTWKRAFLYSDKLAGQPHVLIVSLNALCTDTSTNTALGHEFLKYPYHSSDTCNVGIAFQSWQMHIDECLFIGQRFGSIQ